jgi:hypothetical protein
MSELKFSEAIMQIQLHPGDNPTELFSQLTDIENRFGIHNYSEQHVIAATMRFIPADCRAAVHTEMQKRSRLLTLGEMDDCVERYQRSVHPSHSAGKSKSSNNGDAEITLSTAAAAPKGGCLSCGKVGHEKQDYPSRKKGGNGGKRNNGNTGRNSVGVAERLATEKPTAGWTRRMPIVVRLGLRRRMPTRTKRLTLVPQHSKCCVILFVMIQRVVRHS